MLPFVGLGIVCWQVWNEALRWSDVIVFFICYAATALGVTVGFHRLFTHRAFKAKQWVRGTLAILGSAAIEGPITAWVADHRKHHAFADVEGDPHSPHVDHGHGFKGALQGPLARALGLAVHPHPPRQQAALRARPDRRPADQQDRPPVRAVGDGRACWCRSSSAG